MSEIIPADDILKELDEKPMRIMCGKCGKDDFKILVYDGAMIVAVQCSACGQTCEMPVDR